MHSVTGEIRPIFSELDAFLYNLGDPSYSRDIIIQICHQCHCHPRVTDILPLHSSMGSKYIHQRLYRTLGPP